MYDFKGITPEDFELLCEELLKGLEFTIESRPARGPDKGKDILATRYVTDIIGNVEEERYLVECKHLAISGKSVSSDDIGNFQAKLSLHKANRYLLITSTVPSETVKDHLAAMSNDRALPYKAGFWAKHDVSKFLDKFPDIASRYFGGAQAPHGKGAAAVAQELRFWLELTGHEVTSIGNGQATSCAFSIKTSTGKEDESIYALCVRGEVSLPTIQEGEHAARSRKSTSLWVVSHDRVAPSAKNYAVTTDGYVQAMSIFEFVSSLIKPYQEWIEALTEDVKRFYVELGCEKPVYKSDGSEIARDPYASVSAYINRWVGEPSGSNVLLLGDFGSGKTWFLLRYTLDRLEQFVASPLSNRLPLYVPLRVVASETDIFQGIAGSVAYRSVPAFLRSEAQLKRLNQDGRILLLLDGFDELERRFNEEAVRDCAKRIVSLANTRAKLLLTSRTHIFKSMWHAQEVFNVIMKDRSLDEPAFEVMQLSTELSSLDEEQIARVIALRADSNHARQLSDYINSSYNLRDLARRPIFLNMIVDTFKRFGTVPLTPAMLYEAYTSMWIMREQWRGTLTSGQKEQFASALAWRMFSLKRIEIPVSEIHAVVDDSLGFSSKTLDELSYEVRTSTFIVRNSVGSYRFAHKSYMEYFASRWIIQELASKRTDVLKFVCDVSDEYVFTPEIDSFLVGCVSEAAIEFLSSMANGSDELADSAARALALMQSPEKKLIH
jgi:hypothetical protein